MYIYMYIYIKNYGKKKFYVQGINIELSRFVCNGLTMIKQHSARKSSAQYSKMQRPGTLAHAKKLNKNLKNKLKMIKT